MEDLFTDGSVSQERSAADLLETLSAPLSQESRQVRV